MKDKLFIMAIAVMLGIGVFSTVGFYYIIWHFVHKFW